MAGNGGLSYVSFSLLCRHYTSHVTSELYKDWNDTCKPNFEAFVEADMQVIPSPPYTLHVT